MMIFHRLVQAGFMFLSAGKIEQSSINSMSWKRFSKSVLGLQFHFHKTMKFCKIKNYFLIIDAGMKMFMGKMVLSKILCKSWVWVMGWFGFGVLYYLKLKLF